MLNVATLNPDGRQLIRDGFVHNLAAATTDVGRNTVVRSAHTALPGLAPKLQHTLKTMPFTRAFDAAVSEVLFGKPQKRQAKRR
jgi:hypothetical protein